MSALEDLDHDVGIDAVDVTGDGRVHSCLLNGGYRSLIRDAERFIGGGAKVRRAVIAVPAYFNPVSGTKWGCMIGRLYQARYVIG